MFKGEIPEDDSCCRSYGPLCFGIVDNEYCVLWRVCNGKSYHGFVLRSLLTNHWIVNLKMNIKGGAYKHGGLPLFECTKNFPNPLPLNPPPRHCFLQPSNV